VTINPSHPSPIMKHPKGTLAWDSWFCFFAHIKPTFLGQRRRLLKIFDFLLNFADKFEFFYRLGVTQLMWSLLLCQLSKSRMRLYVDRVNVEWDSMSTDSIPAIYKNSALTQVMWSLTPHWLNRHGISLSVDPVDRESHSVSTQCAEDKLSQHRHTKPSLMPLKGQPFEKSTKKHSNGSNISQKQLNFFT
jgi:hypothetical protein